MVQPESLVVGPLGRAEFGAPRGPRGPQLLDDFGVRRCPIRIDVLYRVFHLSW